MKKIFALLCLIFVLISCGKDPETVVESQSGTIVDDVVNVTTPTNPEDPQDDFLTENPVVEVATYSEVQNNNSTSRFALKNDMVFWKDTIESIVTKCQYFEWENNFVFEQWERVDRPAFTMKDYFYDAVENDYCPWMESKEEKYIMVDSILSWELPEKFLSFDGIDSLSEVNLSDLNVDPNWGVESKMWMLALLGIYISFIENEEDFLRYQQMYTDYAQEIYNETWIGSEELYDTIMLANISRYGNCKNYIEENLISY